MMPIHNPNGTVVPQPAPTAEVPVIETASVYQNTNERVKVRPHIEGNSWTVEYYGRHYGDIDPATLPNDIQDPSLIQYQLVKNMELRVTGELQHDVDPESQTVTVTGSANMYPIVIPIIGDCFIAPMGDGTYGKFGITSTERQSIYKTSAWTVNYTLISIVTESVINDLNEQVVQTLVFDLKGLNEAGGALATISEYERNVLRKNLIQEMINWYYDDFFKPTIKTFLVPDELYKVYDPYVVEYWNKIVGKELIGNKVIPHEFDLRHSLFKVDYVTFWDALFSQERRILDRAVHSMRHLNTIMFSQSYIHFTIHSSGLDRIVQPDEVNGLVITGGTQDEENPKPPYVLSANFYGRLTEAQTPLELLVNQAIDKEPIPFSSVKPIVDTLGVMTLLERFYHIPILITLLTLSR